MSNSGFYSGKVKRTCRTDGCEAQTGHPYWYCEPCRDARNVPKKSKAATPLRDRIKRGDKIGRWTVIGYNTTHDERGRNHKIRCRCVCKHEQFVPLERLSPYWLRKNPILGCKSKRCQNAFKANRK